MKKIIIFLAMLFVSSQSMGQTKDQYHEMIGQSLLKYIEDKQEFYNRFNMPLDFSSSYLLTEHYPIGYEFPQEVIDQGFKFGDWRDIEKRLRNSHINSLDKSIGVTGYLGPRIKGETIEIWFSNWGVYRKRNITCISSGPGFKVTWRYSTEEDKWILIDAE